MAPISARSRQWSARALQALRAAAFLSIATGVNRVLETLYPKYEPIYAYLIAVLIVAWLGSALLGVTAAVASAILYDWMFAPVRAVPSMSFAIPLTIAVAVAIATRAARLPLQRPALPPAPQPPLLPAAEPGPLRVDVLADDERARELQQQVTQLKRQLAEARMRADDEDRARGEERAAAESRLKQLTGEIESLRQQVVERGGQFALLSRESDALAQRLVESEARTADEMARAGREAALREQAESAGRDALQKAVAELSARHDAAIEEAKERADAAAKRTEALQKALANERARADRQSQEYAAAIANRATDEAVAEAKQRADSAAQRAEALQSELSSVRARADRQAGEYATAIAERQKQNDAAAEKVRALQSELDRAIVSLNEESARAGREASLRSQLEAAARETLSRTAVVSAAHQRDAAEAREAARAAEERVRGMQREIEQVRADGDATGKDLLALMTERDALQRLIEEARERFARQEGDLNARLETQRDDLNHEFDAKLQKIVDGLTEDHENAIGDAVLEREAARAESRRLTQRAQELERTVLDERSARERLQAEWNAKLQKIVAHLTEDHEADIGEAMLQREAARAEVRNLSAKLAALQKQLEDEREKFRQFALRRPATVEQRIPAAPLNRPRVILVVHSDAGVRAMAKHTLQQDGYIVMTAADGLEGLRTATQHKPDIVLAEQVMPKMNARELVQLLKSKRETADVKIVLVASNGEIGRGADFTADDVVRNPADFNELRTALANVLGRGTRTSSS